MTTKTLAFVRVEDGEPTTVGILVLGVAYDGMTDEDALKRLRGAITDWVNQSEEGAKAWKESSQDFNIGDLAHHDSSPTLGRHLERHGIFYLTLEVADPRPRAIEYDAKLVNEDGVA